MVIYTFECCIAYRECLSTGGDVISYQVMAGRLAIVDSDLMKGVVDFRTELLRQVCKRGRKGFMAVPGPGPGHPRLWPSLAHHSAIDASGP